MQKNLNHWYDGWIYHHFIAPNQREYYIEAMRMIDRDANVLDVACATGGFAFFAADKVNKITGLDLSQRNIKKANELLESNGHRNIDFVHGNALELSELFSGQFDYSFISFALHEMPADIREKVLREMSKVSKKVIIADFSVDMQVNFRGIVSRMAEFFAGSDHFANFLDFRKSGGITALLEKINLKIIKRKQTANNTSEIILAEIK